MSHYVVLTCSASLDGRIRTYAEESDTLAVIALFGEAVDAARIDDGHGVSYIVECASQRGDAGAFRLHSIACAAGIPVHVQ